MKKKNLYYLCNSLLIILFCDASFLLAQTEFLRTNTNSEEFGYVIQTSSYGKIEQSERFLSVIPIQIENPWISQQEGKIQINLPGTDISAEAIVTIPRRFSDFNYMWRGDFLDENGLVIGYAKFFRREDKKFGEIRYADRHFLIRDLNLIFEDDQVLIELASDVVEDNICGTNSSGYTSTSELVDFNSSNKYQVVERESVLQRGPGGNGECENAIISILVLYTQEVIEEEILAPEERAEIGVAALNEALSRSAIPGVEVSAELIGVEFLDNYVEQGDAELIVNNILPDNPTVESLRMIKGADLVVLFQSSELFVITDNGQLNTNIAGYANINGVTEVDQVPDENRIYSVIEIDAPSEIFAHEVGHLLGCRHLKEDDPHAFANAHQLCMDPIVIDGDVINCGYNKVTLMDAGGQFERILHFSNPAVDYLGVPTGTEEHYNALMIASTACYISAFKDTSTFTAFGSGPSNVYHNDESSFLYSAFYWGCADGPVTYHWEISWDDQSNFQDLSDFPHEEDVVLEGDDIPLNEYGVLNSLGYIRFSATCASENAFRCHIIPVTNWSSQQNLTISTNEFPVPLHLYKEMPGEELMFFSSSDADMKISVYPNPINDVLRMNLQVQSDVEILVNLVSEQGLRKQLYRGTIDQEFETLDFSVGEAPTGFYVLEIQSSQQHFGIPVIISR